MAKVFQLMYENEVPGVHKYPLGISLGFFRPHAGEIHLIAALKPKT